MVGYPFVLPDMIGGNGYEDNPIARTKSKELYIRWLQANVFMPALQFSFVPWDFDEQTITLTRKYTSLHAEYADYIIERFKLAVQSGHPVNAPVWWISPNDRTAHGIYDRKIFFNFFFSIFFFKQKFYFVLHLQNFYWVMKFWWLLFWRKEKQPEIFIYQKVNGLIRKMVKHI